MKTVGVDFRRLAKVRVEAVGVIEVWRSAGGVAAVAIGYCIHQPAAVSHQVPFLRGIGQMHGCDGQTSFDFGGIDIAIFAVLVAPGDDRDPSLLQVSDFRRSYERSERSG